MPGNIFSSDWHSGDPIGAPNIDPQNPDDPSNIPHPPNWWDRTRDWTSAHLAPYVDAIARAGRYIEPTQDSRPPPMAPSAPHVATAGRGALRQWQPRQAPNLAGRPDQNGLFPRFYTYGSFAGGGSTGGMHVMAHRPHIATQAPEPQSPHLFRGPGAGQDDNIDAKVSPGEYIVSAEDVSMLGDGSNEEGARRLDAARGALRMHKTGQKKFPPKARNPLSYLKKRAS